MGKISFILALLATFTFVLSFYFGFTSTGEFIVSSREIKPLAYLPIPQIAQTYLPGPLELASISTNVLGAQPITPEDIVKYVNIERAKNGAKPLKIEPTLTQAASMRAEVILKHENFSHQDPYEGIELITVLQKLGYYYQYASENIGMGGTTAENFVSGFMSSMSHRENLLNPHLSHTGVAVVSGPYKQYYVNIVVQMFAIPAASKEQYLGYNRQDIVFYQKLFTDIQSQLAKSYLFIEKGLGEQQYYLKWKDILERQSEIIASVYDYMKQGKPLVTSQLDLMRQYNSNWKQAPKG